MTEIHTLTTKQFPDDFSSFLNYQGMTRDEIKLILKQMDWTDSSEKNYFQIITRMAKAIARSKRVEPLRTDNEH